ncbi:DUF6010 family protein [Pollutibacter soli]|uniref:DUF6010 family protein n=1 Tax=Pollutibacter soli TaxID=3034157 RepID=UPI00301407CD
MTSSIIGISLGFIIILLFTGLKHMDKKLVYGLILTAIGFLYVGFAWMDWQALIINIVQAVFFLFLSYYGVRKGLYVLAGGFFLHGIWDWLYSLFQNPGLIPPHYDLFCLSIDFTFGIYLVVLQQGVVRDSRKETLGSSGLSL